MATAASHSVEEVSYMKGLYNIGDGNGTYVNEVDIHSFLDKLILSETM